MQLIYTIFLGFFLSFLGQLPLGTISMTGTQIAVQEGFKKAWQYAIGVALIEMICLRLVLSGLNFISGHAIAFLILNWVAVILFMVLGVLGFISAMRQRGEKKALLLSSRLNRFLLGVTISALNPAQIAFWFIWTSYFISQHWLRTDLRSLNVFTIGSGFGTVAGLAVYMYGGNFLITKMQTSTRTLNKIMGLVFIIAAFAQMYRLIAA